MSNMNLQRPSGDALSWLLGSAALVIVIAGMRAAQGLVVPFLVASFIAVICTPAMQWLQKRGMPGWLSILTVILAVTAVALVVVAVMTRSINEFLQQTDKYERNLDAMQGRLASWIKEKYSSLSTEISDALNTGAVLDFIKRLLIGVSGTFSNLFLVLLTVFFMLVEAAGFPRKILALSGGSQAALEKGGIVREAIVRYMTLKTILSLLTGVLVGMWALLMQIDFPVLWGMMAFFLNFIPNVGSIIAAVPAVILALVQYNPTIAIATAGGYLAINVLIGNVVEPRVMGKGLGLSTLVVFISLVFWGWVLGTVGMLLSVPLTMIVKIVMESFDQTRWLAILLASNPEPQPDSAP